jgi:hypothetical protein
MSTAGAQRLGGSPFEGRSPASARPALHLVHGGRPGRPAAGSGPRALVGTELDVAVRRRRRASSRVRRQRVVAGAAVAAVIGLLALPLTAHSNPSSSLAAVPVASAAVLPLQAQAGHGVYYVVRPGDTLASIARGLDPKDPGTTAARLARRLGSSAVVPGEHIPVG